MVTSDPKGDIAPLFLKDVADEHGKVKPRLVNIDSQKVRLIYEQGLQYITEEDYEAAREYVPDPENYNMKNILDW
jgi:6-phosphofructokinase 1